ncbi:MAG: hypothetical protein HYX28_10175 [Candidatus Koribacter versatilis]|uniref:Uncharacterized protein n=1 Tax=Candidatus Korobacter versatilis TaxID=658062 RepID=A0A932A9F1_9BACT|nr:hypothetical protein [Candidatus Koribacter versatilis]
MQRDPGKPSSSKHATGELAPTTGVYRVIHSQHNLPAEVTVHSGTGFPRCAACAAAVRFELLRPTLRDLPAGIIRLNILPVLDADEEAEAAS